MDDLHDDMRALVAEAELQWQSATVAVVRAYLAGTPLTDERRAAAEQLVGSLRTELHRLTGLAHAVGPSESRRDGPPIARDTRALSGETNEVRALFAPDLPRPR